MQSSLEPHRAEEAGPLDERSLRILEFERRSWSHSSLKEEAIREEFALSAARYYRLLGTLIDSPAALRHDPMLVRRLQRLRDARAEARTRRVLPRPGMTPSLRR